MKPYILSIHTASAMGIKMRSHTSVGVIAGKGLRGDRYALECGAYSKPTKRQPHRNVSFISSQALVEAAKAGRSFDAGETRRNIVVGGVGPAELNSWVGNIILVGTVAFRIMELADPCERPGKLSGKEGFAQSFAGRGGVRGEALSDGEIWVGEIIEIETAQ